MFTITLFVSNQLHNLKKNYFFLVQRGVMTPMEISEGLGLYDLRNRTWHVQGTCALTGDGLYEGLDWLVTALKELQVSGRHWAGISSSCLQTFRWLEAEELCVYISFLLLLDAFGFVGDGISTDLFWDVSKLFSVSVHNGLCMMLKVVFWLYLTQMLSHDIRTCHDSSIPVMTQMMQLCCGNYYLFYRA